MTNTESELIRAAILWDRPALVEAQRQDASNFVQLLELRLPNTNGESPTQETPLALAVDGLARELQGNQDGALEAYEVLSSSEEPWTRLLGHLLKAWMGSAGQDRFHVVADTLLSGVFSSDIISRCFSKLATWALDQGWPQLARDFFERAIGHASGDLETALRLAVSEANGARVSAYAIQAHLTDPMVCYPWIHDRLADASLSAMEGILTDSAASPWKWTVSFGAGPTTLHDALELQCTWAGAAWLLPIVRRQQGAVHLRNAGSSEEVARGVAAWILGNGPDVTQILDEHEHQFDDTTATRITGHYLRNGDRLLTASPYIQTCLALWDEIPQDVADSILAELRLTQDLVAATHDDASRLFGTLLLRSPRNWWAFFDRLSESEQLAACLNVPPVAIASLSREQVLELLPRLSPLLLQDRNVSVNASYAWGTMAALLDRHPSSEDLDEFRQLVPPQLVPMIYEAWPTVLTPQTIARAASDLSRTLESDLEDARRGQFAGRFFEPATTLARCASLSGTVAESAASLLVDVATSEHVLDDQRFYAFRGLAILAANDCLPEAQATTLRTSRYKAGRAIWDNRISEEQLRVAQTAVFAILSPGSRDKEILAASRNSDVRIRSIGTDTAATLSDRRRSVAIDTALLGALYDPYRGVQNAAIAALGGPGISNKSLMHTASQRLVDMWGTAHRDVRAVITSTSVKWMREARHLRQASLLLKRASSDRSWSVRYAATLEIGGPSASRLDPQMTGTVKDD